jgi:hypothetical protein
VRVFASAIWMLAGASGAFGQSYSVSGQVGYLQEWEIKADVAKTVTSAAEEYSGPATLRHVGICSANGIEEKTGEVRLKVSLRTQAIEGTLTIKDDTCRIVASASGVYSGLLSCRSGPEVPMNFSLNQASVSDPSGPSAGK